MSKRRERGEGGLFRIAGSSNWYAKIQGKRWSTGTPIKAEALAKLRERAGRASLGIREPNTLLAYEDVREGLLSKYRIGKQNGHSLRVKRDGTEDIFGLKHLDAFFAGRKVINMTPTLFKHFIKKRLAEGAAPGTVNRNLQLLRRMLYQARKEDPSVTVPHFPLLEEAEPRQGFIEDDDFAKLFLALPERLRTFVLLLYTCGVRTGEAKKIRWEYVDLDAHEIRLPGSITKNGKPRTLPLVDLLVKRLRDERHESGRVFNIGVFHKAWWTACAKVGLGKRIPGKQNGGYGTYVGLIPHDLRRSAVRNFVRAGVSTTIAKKISGHLTDAVFERYNITSTEDLHKAANRIGANLALPAIGSSSGQVTRVKRVKQTRSLLLSNSSGIV